MTFGDIIYLIGNLKDGQLRQKISGHYHIRNIKVFESYMNTIRLLRNLCAHGHDIYDLNLQKSIKAGPVPALEGKRHHNLTGCLLVTSYILRTISVNCADEMKRRLEERLSWSEVDKIREVISDIEINLL